jgi:hypothetical protein
LGAIDTGFAEFGEETNKKIRAELLDEGLEIITQLWNGKIQYQGTHYQIRESTFFERHPPPSLIQQPRIPIWVVAAWPWEKSMKRVLKYDGILPAIMFKKGQFEKVTPEYVREIKKYIAEKRQRTGSFDIVIEGTTPINNQAQALEIIKPFEEAGATWWIESMWEETSLNPVLEKIQEGPPK